jgi:hypothetical protein
MISGAEASSDDSILAVRRGVYEVSVAHRTGGWHLNSLFLSLFQGQFQQQ